MVVGTSKLLVNRLIPSAQVLFNVIIDLFQSQLEEVDHSFPFCLRKLTKKLQYFHFVRVKAG